MINLKNQYVSVVGINGNTFGGDQLQCKSKILRRCGCGLVAALDTLIYLSRNNPSIYLPGYKFLPAPIPLYKYEELLGSLAKSYFPVMYPFGITGFGLATGINLFFIRHSIPLKARWGMSNAKLTARISTMLNADIPVILAVGPNFPKFWQHKNISFHSSQIEHFSPNIGAHAHFVTVTAIDDLWLEISSWGCKYYLRIDELYKYSKECSNSLLCNILYIEQK